MCALCIDCEFGEFCFGKDCKYPKRDCAHNPIKKERLFVRKFDAAVNHREQILSKHGAKENNHEI